MQEWKWEKRYTTAPQAVSDPGESLSTQASPELAVTQWMSTNVSEVRFCCWLKRVTLI